MKLTIIYLAAGSSKRFGGDKLTADFNGKPLYRTVLDRLIDICAVHKDFEIAVVTKNKKILDEISSFPVKAVYSENSEKGISYSIKAGLCAVPDSEYYAFFVADQPFLTTETITDFLEKAILSGKKTGCVKCGEESGNPAFFSKTLVPELMALIGDTGGKSIVKKYLSEAFFYSVPEKELYDIDTRSQMNALKSLK